MSNNSIKPNKLKIRNSKFILGETVEQLSKLDTNSVDMAFCDPPYYLQLSKTLYRPDQTRVSGVDDKWDQFKSYEDYDNFSKKWLLHIKRILKPNATIWVIGTYHNIYRIGYLMQNFNFWILNDLTWIKTNPMPNFKGTRFTNAHENLIWASKSKDSKYTFNYKTMKLMNNNKQMRSDWLLNVCSGKERLKDKNNIKLHNAQKPEQLLERIVLASTRVGDLVLDPFFGTGTTGVVCKRLGRKFIGIERKSSYLVAAKERILKIKRLQSKNLENVTSDFREKRIAFSNLLKKGLIKPGNSLYDSRKKIRATVLSNGSLKFKNDTGSIHKIGAIVQKKHACNGWDFWYVHHNKKLISINEHRSHLRQEILEKE